MDENTIIDFIKDVGFPVAVTCFLLYKDLKFNVKVVDTLSQVSATMKTLSLRLDKMEE